MSNGSNSSVSEVSSRTVTQAIPITSTRPTPPRTVHKIFKPILKPTATEHEPSDNGRRHAMMIVFMIVVCATFVAGFIVYTCTVKHRRRRILEETRKRISEVVITAGSKRSDMLSSSSAGGDKRLSNRTGSSLSKESRQQLGSMDTLKEFHCSGPIVMQANFKGEIKHELDKTLSHSFKQPLQFDPAHNEIVFIGTDIDRIEGRSQGPSREDIVPGEHPTKMQITYAVREKVKHCLTFLDECATQTTSTVAKKVHTRKNRVHTNTMYNDSRKNRDSEFNDSSTTLNTAYMESQWKTKQKDVKKLSKSKEALEKPKTPDRKRVPTKTKTSSVINHRKEKPKKTSPTVVHIAKVKSKNDNSIQLDKTADDSTRKILPWAARRKQSSPCSIQHNEDVFPRYDPTQESEEKSKTADEITANTSEWKLNVKKKKHRTPANNRKRDEKEVSLKITQCSRSEIRSGSSNSATQ